MKPTNFIFIAYLKKRWRNLGSQVLENQELKIEILTKGAELKSVQSKNDGTEYIWQADPKIWGRHSPVLFPVVGKLKRNQYQFERKNYELSQHGFARDREFQVTKKEPDTIEFRLRADNETLTVYPFNFELTIKYELVGNRVIVIYLVKNLSEKEEMYFSIGAHPGFRC